MTLTKQSQPAAVDRSSPLPLWAQIHADLERRLAAGEFTDTFPGELALVVEYDVSRHTVREAVRRMREDGIVIAERGRPPRLAEGTQIVQPLGALYSLFASVEAAGLVQRSIVRTLDIRTDEIVAEHLELPGTADLFYLERVRLAGEEPLAVDRIWLPAALAAPLLDADFTHTALYTELANRCAVRLEGGEEHINAVMPTPGQRDLLAVPSDVAAFAIERRAFFRGQPAEWRHTVVRGDRYTVSAKFSARMGYQLDMTTRDGAARADLTHPAPASRSSATA